MNGVTQEVLDQWGEKKLRVLMHSRSDATGRYRRGADLTCPVPLREHAKSAAKGFELVEVTHVPHGTLTAPWTQDVR